MLPLAEELQANITAQQRSEELLELQETLSWPSLASLCPDSYIPEVREMGDSSPSGHPNPSAGAVSGAAAVQSPVGHTHKTASPLWSAATH